MREPIARNGVPSAKTRSPVKTTRCRGSHTIESPVVCATPGWMTCTSVPPTCTVARSLYVRSGAVMSIAPKSVAGQISSSWCPAASCSVRALSCPRISASGAKTPLP